MKKRYVEFADIVKEQLDRALTQEDTLDEMSRVLAECIKAGGVTSLDYSTQFTSRHSSGKMLKDVSDIVLGFWQKKALIHQSG